MGDEAPARLRQPSRRALMSLRCTRGGTAPPTASCAALAPRFAITCSQELLEATAALSAQHGLLVHTHASEQREEIAVVRARTGMDNVAYLASLGLASDRLCAAHCVWVTEAEQQLMAERSVNVLHCPGSNLKLGSGIAPVPEMRARGISVSLGADGGACNNTLDMFQEMRLAATLQAMRLGPGALTARDAVWMATREGARALGQADRLGSIEAGKLADIIVVRTGNVHQRPAADPYSTLVYASRPGDVRTTIIAGRVVYRDGNLTWADRHDIGHEADRARKGCASAQAYSHTCVGAAIMSARQWIPSRYRLLWIFLSITLVLTATLGWLGWQLLQQDRALARQRAQERVEVAADLITAALQRDLSELEQDLTRLASMSGDGLARDSLAFSRRLPASAVLLLINADGVEPLPDDRLLFRPFLPPAKEPQSAAFSAAEALEFQKGDHAGAIAALQEPARAADPQVRAAALNRMARNQRKTGRWEDAMRAYGELRALGPVTVGGLPAELLARDAMCALLEEHGDLVRVKEEASAVYADLGQGRWKISEAAYAYYAGQARKRTGAAAADGTRLDAIALSEAAQVLWDEWQQAGRESPLPMAAGCSGFPNGQSCSSGAVRQIAWRRWPPGQLSWNRHGSKRSSRCWRTTTRRSGCSMRMASQSGETRRLPAVARRFGWALPPGCPG
jgi:hypothetical protein